MEAFQCKRTKECGDICKLLDQQGVNTRSESNQCNTPNLFDEQNGELFVNLDSEPRNRELTAFVLSSLYNVLSRHDYEPANLDELIAIQYDELTAHKNMWQALLNASKEGRTFTNAERDYYQNKLDEAIKHRHEVFTELSHEDRVQAMAAFDSQTLREYKIVFDDQAIDIISKDVSNRVDNKHSLLVGDKGIAKTNLAVFVMDMANGIDDRVFIAGKGDKMSDEIMGKHDYDKATNQLRFVDSPLLKAITEGKSVVADEFNANDPKIVIRLNQVFLSRPGELIAIDEDGGRMVKVANGFHVSATANEISSNYRDRNRIDPATRDRFDIINVHFPDESNENPLLQEPVELTRLALASVCNERGVISPHVDVNTLVKFVKLAHVTQHLYSKPLAEGLRSTLSESGSSISTADITGMEKPVMSDCISPRTMMDALTRCADGNKPRMNLDTKIQEIVRGLDQGGTTNNANWANKTLRYLSRTDRSR